MDLGRGMTGRRHGDAGGSSRVGLEHLEHPPPGAQLVRGAPPIAGWVFFMDNPSYKWMMTGGTTVFGETSILDSPRKKK